MIYAKKKNVTEDEFVDLLKKSRALLLKFLTQKKDISPISFEIIVFKKMEEAAKGTILENKIEQTRIHAFPDIIANKYYGVEVKMTISDHWTSTGNSVLESSRIDDIERIYIMFGKFGGEFDIRYRLYQECLPAISVTHSPRYRINMELDEGESIFDKMGIDYDTLRKSENPINTIKNYYRKRLKDGEEVWWIDPSQEEIPAHIIRPSKSLSKEEKENFIVEAMIFFPEIFGKKQDKYERAAAYLIAEYNVVSANLRDFFSSGGTVEIQVKKKKFVTSKIYYNLLIRAKAIKEKINQLQEEDLKHYWKIDKLEKNRLLLWKKIVNEKMPKDLPVSGSDIFKSGL